MNNEQKYKTCFDEIPVGIAFVDTNGNFLDVNNQLCQFLGYTESELLQTTFKAISLAEDLPESFAWIKASLAGEISHHFSKIKRYYHKNGHLVWAKLTTTLIRDENNNPLYFLSSIQDVAELKQAENALDDSLIKLKKAYADLEKSSCIDGLTGVYNRTSFKKLLYYAFESFNTHQKKATLIFIDLDNFKCVNDVYGHLNGDKALISLTQKLKNMVRNNDAIGRYGGDEFTILLNGTTNKEAEELCYRIGDRFDFTVESGDVVSVGISIGISELSNKITTIEQWLSQADNLMYQQKKSH